MRFIVAGAVSAAMFLQAGNTASQEQGGPALERVNAQTALNASDLLRIARTSKIGVSDQFKAPPWAAMIGKPFKVDIALKPSNPFRNTPAFDYDLSRQILSMNAGGRSFQISGAARKAGHFIGQTAFGVKAGVDLYTGSSFNIEQASLDTGENITPSLTFSEHLPPDAARSLSKRLRLVISGKLEKEEPFGLGVCYTHTDTATLDDPSEGRERRCTVYVSYEHASLIDTADGSVLAEWIRDQPITSKKHSTATPF